MWFESTSGTVDNIPVWRAKPACCQFQNRFCEQIWQQLKEPAFLDSEIEAIPAKAKFLCRNQGIIEKSCQNDTKGGLPAIPYLVCKYWRRSTFRLTYWTWNVMMKMQRLSLPSV
jgi:hypothetical protein